MNRRIVCCTNAYPPRAIGGAEIVVHEQAKAMNRAGNQVVVFSGDLNPSGSRHSVQLDSYEGVTVHRIVLHHVDFDWKRTGFVNSIIDTELLRILDRFQPNVVHLHNMHGLSMSVVRRLKWRGVRTVLTLHDHWAVCYKNTLLKLDTEICRDYSRCAECMRFIVTDSGQNIPIRFRNDYLRFQLDGIDHFISPSAYLAKAYLGAGFPEAKMRIIGNGVDIQRYRTRRKSNSVDARCRFTFVGRLALHKGVDVLLDAFGKLSEHADVSLRIVGSGELAGALAERIRECGFTRRINLAGAIDNDKIPEVLAETDVLVLPSVWPENQPVTIMEALASGTPVIASRIGGIPELVRDGENGFLVTPGDPIALAYSMERFVRDPDLLERMGRAATASIAGMRVDDSVDRILALYDERAIPASSDVSRGRNILCVGHNIEPQCVVALENLLLLPEVRDWRFLWDQWVEPRDVENVDLIWIVDRDVRYDSIRRLCTGNVPRIVPSLNRLLRRKRIPMDGDTCYRTAADIESAITGCLL